MSPGTAIAVVALVPAAPIKVTAHLIKQAALQAHATSNPSSICAYVGRAPACAGSSDSTSTICAYSPDSVSMASAHDAARPSDEHRHASHQTHSRCPFAPIPFPGRWGGRLFLDDVVSCASRKWKPGTMHSLAAVPAPGVLAMPHPSVGGQAGASVGGRSAVGSRRRGPWGAPRGGRQDGRRGGAAHGDAALRVVASGLGT